VAQLDVNVSGQVLVSVSARGNGETCLWDVATGQRLATLPTTGHGTLLTEEFKVRLDCWN
jgi:hypothetical protein